MTNLVTCLAVVSDDTVFSGSDNCRIKVWARAGAVRWPSEGGRMRAGGRPGGCGKLA